MKEKFTTPEMEIITFDTNNIETDVIVSSGGGQDGGEFTPGV